ncbi:MAG TPA: hypothetical protein VHB73_06955 [Alphaproteobacteria bacterium]|nr:hypothetical protein [Alphaproteobacteria bacterium]
MANNSDSCPYTSFLCGKGTCIISMAVLVLVLVNCTLISLNRMQGDEIIKMQESLAEKGKKLQQNQVFANVFQGLLQALAQDAVVRKDEQIKNLLTQNGIKLNPAGAKGAPAQGGEAPAPAPSTP